MKKKPDFIGGLPIKEYNRRYERRKYLRLKSAGTCVICEHKKASGGFVTCRRCRVKLRANALRYWRRRYVLGVNSQAEAKSWAEKVKLTRQEEKLAAYDAYGGRKCACCGEAELGFLTLDHINGDGSKEKKSHGGYPYNYRQLREMGYPPGRQVLCYNCNCGRARNKGICPHKQAKSPPAKVTP